MSGGFPFPVSDNRSYPSRLTTRFQDGHSLITAQDEQNVTSPYSDLFHPDYPVQPGEQYVDPYIDSGGVTASVHASTSSQFHHVQYSPVLPNPHPNAHTGESAVNTAGRPPDYHSKGSSSSSLTSLSPRESPDAHALQDTQLRGLSRPLVKARREKPRIELAPDQPLTTQGKPRARVYVACVQCRGRKIRCDGAKPVCHNCSRRTTGTATPQCSYDAAPKRRGPDKNPGARQRATISESSEGGNARRRRKRTAGTHREEDSASIDANNPDAQDPDSPLGYKMMQAQSLDLATSPVDGFPERAVHSRPIGLSLEVDDAALYRHQNHDSPLSLSSATSSLFSPLGYVALTSELGTNAIRRESHNSAQLAHTRSYSYTSPISDITYVGCVPEPYIISTTDQHEYDEYECSSQIGAEPSSRFTRETWWDALLSLYSSRVPLVQDRSSSALTLTPALRETTAQKIITDLRFLYRASNYWFSFVNIPKFFGRLLDPTRRNDMQPCLILAALAVATFIQSSNQEAGAKGRAWALKLRDLAQSALEASLSSRWIDESLVHASWLIAFFEICAHPDHSTDRVRSSMSMLDSLIRSLALTTLDAEEPNVSVFGSHLVPTVSSVASIAPWEPYQDAAGPLVNGRPPSSSQPQSTKGCSCGPFTLGQNWAAAKEVTPLWLTTPAWDSEWSEGEIRKEECRRIVWSSVMLAAGHSSYTAVSDGFSTMNLFIMDPANYALFFPGESLRPASPASKDTVWALYMRAMMLWHSCVRMRWDAAMTEAQKAQFAVGAWLETDKIEEALERHACDVERAVLYVGREYLFNSRMCISYEFQRYIPHAMANANMFFCRKRAEEWLTHQAMVAKRTIHGLQTVTGQPSISLARRPFFVFWFMSQISRALTLWSYDHSLTIAIDVSKALLAPIEYLMSIWPCPEQARRYEELLDSVSNACFIAGLPPPSMDASARLVIT